MPELRLARTFCEGSAIWLWASRAMLQAMEQAAQSSPSANASSFSGLLASLTSSADNKTDHAAAWSDDALGDDVVTLSYERALRNHARYRPADDGDLRRPTAAPMDDAKTTAPNVTFKHGAGLAAQADTAPQKAPSRDLRTSSVTIRLSDAECVLVRQRAAEAGLTVSAYLRSCVLEADALRAQVKEALAEMRKAGTKRTRDQGNEVARQQGSKETHISWVQRLLGKRS
jgi:hypothetical protein